MLPEREKLVVISRAMGKCGGCLAACGSCPFNREGSEGSSLVPSSLMTRTIKRMAESNVYGLL